MNQYNDEPQINYGYMASATGIGLGGFALSSRIARAYEGKIAAKMNSMKFKDAKTQAWWDKKNPYNNGKVPYGSKGWTSKQWDTPLKERWGFGKGKLPFTEDVSYFSPFRKREANTVDQIFNREKNLLKTGNKVRIFPAAYLFGAMTINSELDERQDALGLVTGIGKEVSAIAGARLGMVAGSPVGRFLGAGLPGMSRIGTIAGGAVGGILGYGVLSGLQAMSKMGRSWSYPELGGSFIDSAESQTMRARSLNAIRTSQFNIRSELGNEALRLAGL